MKVICFTLLFLAFSSSQLSHSKAEPKHPLCPSKTNTGIPSYMLEKPQLLANWLNSPAGLNVRSVKDFLCCLPNDIRKNLDIAHTSHAGQPGDPQSPRIILRSSVEKDERGGKRLNIPLMLSVNGGAEGQAQRNSVEILHIDPVRRQNFYYDLELHGQRRIQKLSPNPPFCMSCHGGANPTGYTEARAIFHEDPVWPNFVGGSQGCLKVENQLMKRASDEAVEQAKANDRFTCLDFSLFDQTGDASVVDGRGNALSHLSDTHAVMKGQNHQRIYKDLFKNPNYPVFKYALLGRFYCDSFDLKLSDYIPTDQINNMKANVNIHRDLAKWGDLYRNSMDALNGLVSTETQRRANMNRLLTTPNGPETTGVQPGNGWLSCSESLSQGNRALLVKDFTMQVHPQSKTDPILNRISLDNFLRAGPGVHTGIDPLTRFLIEGLGGSTEHWHMTHLAGVVASDFSPMGDELLNRAATYSMSNKDLLEHVSKNHAGEWKIKEGLKDDFCELLKKKSKEAFMRDQMQEGHPPATST